MTRTLTVPPAARTAFAAALKNESPHAGGLPDPLPMQRVLRVIDNTAGSSSDLKVLADQDDEGYFLDYLLINNDRDSQTYWHARIREDGAIENLENYEGQWGRRAYHDDPARTEAEHQRMISHNERVHQVLRDKGFL